MLSVSSLHLSLRPLELPTPDRVGPAKVGSQPAAPTVRAPEPERAAEPSALDAAKSQVMALPSTLDMRFEFNALTQAWMLAMTDANSGDVVRKIDLKGFSHGASVSLHQSGHWIDKAV